MPRKIWRRNWAAIASKIVYPDRKVMAICGDGGFMMNSQELETAVRLQLDLIVLILGEIQDADAWKSFKGGESSFPNS